MNGFLQGVKLPSSDLYHMGIGTHKNANLSMRGITLAPRTESGGGVHIAAPKHGVIVLPSLPEIHLELINFLTFLQSVYISNLTPTLSLPPW